MKRLILICLVALVSLAAILPVATAGALSMAPVRFGYVSVPAYSGENFAIPIEYRRNNCAPTAGAMIAQYWHLEGYSRLDHWWVTAHNDLYERMHTNGEGLWWWWFDGTMPWWASSGFQSYAGSKGYSFYTRYWSPEPRTESYYWSALERIAVEIDRGQPLMILFGSGFGSTRYRLPHTNHWCVVSCYFIMEDLRLIRIIDPRDGSKYYVEWDAVYKSVTLLSIRPR